MSTKTIWRNVKGFPNYRISNKGQVQNKKTGHFLKPYEMPSGCITVCLSKNGKAKNKSLGRLILKHFTKKPPKFFTVHKNGDRTNNKLLNLKRGTRSEMLRMHHKNKGKIRGVYKFSRTYKNMKWRSVISVNSKVVTIGYFSTKKEAINSYYNAYKKMFGMTPFKKK